MRKRNEDGSIKCADCGQLALENMTLCKKHLELRRAQNKKKRDKRKSNGKCTECGTNDPMIEFKKCEECHAKRIKVRLLREQKRKENNCCAACGRSKSYVDFWSNRDCVGCHLRSKFEFIGTKEDAEQIINNLLQKQYYKCAVSGRDLKTNKYHIDHIIPRSIQPELLANPDNWQIIVEDANFFKKDKTMEQLLRISLDIVKESIRKGIISIDDLK